MQTARSRPGAIGDRRLVTPKETALSAEQVIIEQCIQIERENYKVTRGGEDTKVLYGYRCTPGTRVEQCGVSCWGDVATVRSTRLESNESNTPSSVTDRREVPAARRRNQHEMSGSMRLGVGLTCENKL